MNQQHIISTKLKDKTNSKSVMALTFPLSDFSLFHPKCSQTNSARDYWGQMARDGSDIGFGFFEV